MDIVKKASKTKKDPWAGKVIAEKYQLETLIGSGGMGSVYIGKHLQLGRTVAIKVMNSDTATDKTASARFIREAKASAKLDHPNTVTIHDFGMIDDSGGAFIVMEYINGETLRKYISTNECIPLQQALEWFMPICEVIEKAHQMGIIHRDLKPENIMLKKSGEEIVVKVVDFGLAKITNDSGVSISQKLTQTGEFMGTPQYMAPEVYDGETADSRADIYALGIILYEMITGKVPFGGSVQNIISGHLFKEPQPVTSINPKLPRELDQVIKLALEKKRENRISSALAFANAFKQVIQPSNTNNLITTFNKSDNTNKIDNLTESTTLSYTNKVAVLDTSSYNTATPAVNSSSETIPTLLDSLPNTHNLKDSRQQNLVSQTKSSSKEMDNKTDGLISILKEKPWLIFLGVGVIFIILMLTIYLSQ